MELKRQKNKTEVWIDGKLAGTVFRMGRAFAYKVNGHDGYAINEYQAVQTIKERFEDEQIYI